MYYTLLEPQNGDLSSPVAQCCTDDQAKSACDLPNVHVDGYNLLVVIPELDPEDIRSSDESAALSGSDVLSRTLFLFGWYCRSLIDLPLWKQKNAEN